MSLNPTELQQVRSTPLFAGLTDTQLGCLEPGEVIAAPPGTVLASEGERTGLFQVLQINPQPTDGNYLRLDIAAEEAKAEG